MVVVLVEVVLEVVTLDRIPDIYIYTILNYPRDYINQSNYL